MKNILYLFVFIFVLLVSGCDQKSSGSGGSSGNTYVAPEKKVYMPYVPSQNMAIDSLLDVNLTATDRDGATISYDDIKCVKNCGNIAVSLNLNTINIISSGGWSGYSQISFVGDNQDKNATNIFTVFVGDIKDSDGDFISDIIEDNFGLDSSNQDQDSDGVLDGNSSSISAISDQFFNNQWYIQAISKNINRFHPISTRPIQGRDLNVMNIYKKYMGYNGGNPIVVQIVDTGVDMDHEDLKPNINLPLSRNSLTRQNGELIDNNGHGTMCAGIVGARAFNGIGVRGVAPFVSIAASNWLSYASIPELEEVWTQNDPYGVISISSNSWGSKYVNDDLVFEELMEYGAKNLRVVNGKPKGKIYLMAAGNGRDKNHDCGLQYINSNKYGITVGALTHENNHTSYSSSCSNLYVSGYGGEMSYDKPAITTTYISGQSKIDTPYWVMTDENGTQCFTNDGSCSSDTLTWGDDTKQNYTYKMNGTSAATPSVAGALALVVEACANLTLRDIKHLIAKHSTQVDSLNTSWKTNSAGYHHSVDYGFGLINPAAMINECENSIENIGEASSDTQTLYNFDLDIDSNTANNKNFTINSTKTIEWVGLTIYSSHADATSLQLNLTSPSGTKTRLMLGNNSAGYFNFYKFGFRIGSVAFYGETANGQWNLEVENKNTTTSTIRKIEFETYGNP